LRQRTANHLADAFNVHLSQRLPPGDVSVPRISFLDCCVYLIYAPDVAGNLVPREVLNWR
jgi:hypothetical protein